MASAHHLTVTLDGVTVKPSLALGGWIAFKPMHDGAMVMGIVLLETRINPVMAKLIEGGLEITAVHDHLCAQARLRPSCMSEGMAIRSKWRALFRRAPPQAITEALKVAFQAPSPHQLPRNIFISVERAGTFAKFPI